jgi:hypothetical protein
MSKLTRYLYEADEVEKSFILSMIYKVDIKECYYWIFELYYSKIDVFPLIWQLYLDYYAVLNPDMENYIMKRQKKWINDYSINHICYIIKNLHVLSLNTDVFILRQLCKQPELYVSKINETKGRQPTWTRIVNKKHIKLLTSIKKRQYNNICYYIKELLTTDDGELLYKDIMKYYAFERGIMFKYNENKNEKTKEFLNLIEKTWETKIKYNCLHYLLAIICQMNVSDNNIHEQRLYIRPNKNDVDEIEKRYEENIIPCYRTLLKKRCYNIDEKIGMFLDIPRFTFMNQDVYKKEILEHWEYYASKTPFWREIIEQYNGLIDNENKSIIFNDDNSSERFYSLYGFEFDEQNQDIQNMSLKVIEVNDFKTINDHLFKNKIIDYPDDFKLFK